MTTAVLPDCKLQPVLVRQMQVGDRGGVHPSAIRSDGRGQVFVEGGTRLAETGPGRVTVWKCEDGYHIDVTNVPDVRFERHIDVPVFRVRSVSNVNC